MIVANISVVCHSMILNVNISHTHNDYTGYVAYFSMYFTLIIIVNSAGPSVPILEPNSWLCFLILSVFRPDVIV